MFFVRLVWLLVLEALFSKLRFRTIGHMKSHPGPLVLPAHVCGVFVCGGNLVRCVSYSPLPVLEHLFVCLVILYSISGFAWSFWDLLTGPVGSGTLLTDQE